MQDRKTEKDKQRFITRHGKRMVLGVAASCGIVEVTEQLGSAVFENIRRIVLRIHRAL